MFRPANCIVFIFLLFLFVSCRQNTLTEREEVAFWNGRFIDSSYRLLYKNQDTVKALHFFDSAFKKTHFASVYPKAARFGILANYYYFFSADNAATARMIDAALSVYSTPELQNRYPLTYEQYLLFGGHIAYRLSQYNKANGYYFSAKKMADAHLDPCEKASLNYSIAMVLFRQQNFSESMRYFKETYALQETCSPQTTAIVLQQQEIQSNIGLCLIQLKKFDSALVYFDRALQLANQYKDSLGPITMEKIEGVISGHKAQVAMDKGELKEAETLTLKSVALNNREGYEVEHALNMKLQLAEIYSRQRVLGSMNKVLNTMQDTIEKTSAKMRQEWNRLKASYHEQVQQTDSALPFYKASFTLKEAIEEGQKKLTAADVAQQLKAKEQELQIAVLKKDHQITLISLWVILLFSAMSIAIIYLVFQLYRRSKKSLQVSLALNEEIRKQKKAREEETIERHKLITEAVIRAQEAERSVIGLELHDNINQVLTTVKLHNEMMLEGIGDPKLLLPRTLKYLQDCINEIRSLSRRLSAPTLGKISLEESVKDLVDSINSTSKVKITRQIEGLESGLLKKEVHIGIYRILQEQLNNVLKHADASEVLVLLAQKNDKIHLSIRDNGKGFVVQNRKNGIGLINIQTRAESLNGTFKLVSKPGSGCRLEVVLPCLQ